MGEEKSCMVYLALGRGPFADKQSAIDFIGTLPQNEVLLPQGSHRIEKYLNLKSFL